MLPVLGAAGALGGVGGVGTVGTVGGIGGVGTGTDAPAPPADEAEPLTAAPPAPPDVEPLLEARPNTRNPTTPRPIRITSTAARITIITVLLSFDGALLYIGAGGCGGMITGG